MTLKMTSGAIERKAEHLSIFTAEYLKQLIEENELYLEQVAQKEFIIKAAKLALEAKSTYNWGA